MGEDGNATGRATVSDVTPAGKTGPGVAVSAVGSRALRSTAQRGQSKTVRGLRSPEAQFVSRV